MKKKSAFKKNQATLVMAALALGLGAFSYYEYQRAQSEQTQTEKAKMLIGWEKDSEYQSAIMEKNGVTIEVAKVDGVWRVLQPLQDLADEFNVEAWLSDMGTEKGAKIEPKRDANGNILWSEYGLDQNTTRLVLKKKNGESAEIHFAAMNAFDGSYFAKLNDQVFIADKPWVSILSRDLKNLRARSVYRKSADPVAISIQYEKPKKVFSLAQKEGAWAFDKLNFEVSRDNVEAWVADLKRISSVEFIDNAKKLNEYGLNKPLAIFELTFSDQSQQKWSIGKVQSADRVRYFIQVSTETPIFEVDSAFAERVLAHEHFFRDGKKPFALELEKVSQLELEDQGQKVALKKSSDGKWQLQEGPKGYKFSEFLVERYFEKLSGLSADVFLTPAQRKDLKTPQKVLKALDASGNLVKKWSFGDEFSSAETLPRNNPLVYASVTGSEDLFGVRKEVLNGLNFDQLLEKEVAAPNTEPKDHVH